MIDLEKIGKYILYYSSRKMVRPCCSVSHREYVRQCCRGTVDSGAEENCNKGRAEVMAPRLEYEELFNIK